MGKIKQGILGGFSGTVGNVTGSSWKGIDVIKSRPLSVANPKTAAQTAQRNAFSQTVEMAVVLLATIIKPLWDRFAYQMSGFNAFIKANIDNFNADGIVDYSNFIISQGKMAATPVDEIAENTVATTVDVGWITDAGEGYKLDDDVPYVVLINETSGWVVKVAVTTKTRDDERVVDIPVPSLTSGDVLHAYLAFRRADGTVVSNTGYKTRTVA
jgi:hypothetical protein